MGEFCVSFKDNSIYNCYWGETIWFAACTAGATSILAPETNVWADRGCRWATGGDNEEPPQRRAGTLSDAWRSLITTPNVGSGKPNAKQQHMKPHSTSCVSVQTNAHKDARTSQFAVTNGAAKNCSWTLVSPFPVWRRHPLRQRWQGTLGNSHGADLRNTN